MSNVLKIVRNETLKDIQEMVSALEGMSKEERLIVKIFILGLQTTVDNE